MTSTGIRILGSLRTDEGVLAVRMEDRFATGIDDLWSAVTDPARLANWVAQVAGDLQPGGWFDATFTSGWEGPGRVETCEAPHHLLLTMSPGTPDQTVIEAWLTADGDRTRLVVEERGIPVAEAAAHGAGWQTHVEDLATSLAGETRRPWIERVKELMPAYAEMAASLPGAAE